MDPFARFASFVRCKMSESHPEIDLPNEADITSYATWRLCTVVPNIPPALFVRTTCSERIIYMYDQWLTRLAKQIPGQRHDIKHRASNGSTPGSSEQCEICGSRIDLESDKWARCGSGHQFGKYIPTRFCFTADIIVRCGLTLIAIQAPGISKPCGLCNRRYLTEQYLAGIDRKHNNLTIPSTPDDPIEVNSISLVQLLLHVLDMCIHCGGKFIG
jgi:hypothetical protein